MYSNQQLQDSIDQITTFALAEDIGNGDITANLIPADENATATIISREDAVICGRPWVDATFHKVDSTINTHWQVNEGEHVTPNQLLLTVSGPARSLLTAERTALNFLQTLSGTSTRCSHYAKLVAHTEVKLLDTRKTLPGLRLAQKYAVAQGGCFNHRIGLYDAFLIKENHIAACGSISAAIKNAQALNLGKNIEVEVENLDELHEALSAKADIIMLDNFSISDLQQAVSINKKQAKLEASGNVSKETIISIAETGVDYISIGDLTKSCQAIDLSMRFQ
ncbi:carboxylating nicotinate-nucleotide diphosphorylase [Zooshikella marina]|uniref:carboxylating nicotinate-nucleotide diphosphorylase n=1 Tax=Zooshikella ganghwensis TaxID=202772 RepID=UPI001BB00CFE|nr:carboxylating nicotinate-nucleotide diphosphorylase [Zooshikella ganghwensis]MBU2707293.1 carboxylating nicotinate-nucleotide diphosphorylase [Zooshikella ganghwensis]